MGDRLQPPFRLITQGRLALVDARGYSEPTLTTRRRKLALLAWLALNRRPASRDRLIGLFWADRNEERARNSLSDALSHLRRVLGRDALPAYQDEIVLAEETPLSVDVLELDAAARAGEHDRVIDLYTGPFLDSVYVDAAPGFEHWCDRVRARVDSLVAAACRARCVELSRGGDWELCEAVARKWLQVEPTSGAAATYLLDALTAPGTYSAQLAAIREHDALAERVRREFGVGLDPAVTARVRELTRMLQSGEENSRPVAVPPRAPAAPPPPAPQPTEPTKTVETIADVAARPAHAFPKVRVAVVAAAATLAIIAIATAERRSGRAANPGGQAASASAVTKDQARPPHPHSVAVLRFRNLSTDSADVYFSYGMAEEIIHSLGRVRGLQVAARSASFPLSDETLDLTEVARRLNVATVLEGSVRRSGNKVHIAVRLVDAGDRHTLWQETYDRAVNDAVTVQREIAAAVVGALRVQLARGRGVGPAGGAAVEFETFDLYLRGRYAWWTANSEEGLRRSIAYLRRAVARDSAFAPGWAALGGALLELTAMYDVPPSEVVAPARAALLRALSLDSLLADAHASLGYLATFHEQRWDEAEAAFLRALALDVRHTNARLWYAWMLAARGRPDDAVRQLRQAREYEPTSSLLNVRLATMLYFARDYESAIAQARATIEADSSFWLAHRQLGEALLQAGAVEDAIVSLRRAAAVSRTGETRARLAYALARAGDHAAALVLLNELSESAYVSPVELARVHVGLGDNARAMQLLERAAELRVSAVILVGADPAFDPLRTHPRYRTLAQRIGV